MSAGADDKRVAALYGLPLGEFTAERNALVKELRKEGDREGADAVKGLKKPSIEAWTVNQLVREHGGEIERLISLAEEQPDVLASGDRGRVRKAMDDLRGTLTSLTGHAERALRGTDRKPTPALLERVTRMLQSSAGTAEGRDALRGGRFTGEPDEVELPEVDLSAAVSRGAPAPSQRQKAKKAGDEEVKRPARDDAKERAEEKRRRAEYEAERSKLERAVRRADEHAQLLKDRADDLEARLRDLRAAADEAARAAEEAREALIEHSGRSPS